MKESFFAAINKPPCQPFSEERLQTTALVRLGLFDLGGGETQGRESREGVKCVQNGACLSRLQRKRMKVLHPFDFIKLPPS